jgi:hypothetical protein
MSSKSKSSKTTTNNTNSANATFEGSTNVQIVGAGNELTVTDYGVIEEAFDFAGEVSGDSVRSIKNIVEDSYYSTGAIVKDQVGAIKELAVQLKNGDILSAQWMGLAIVAAVVIAFVAWIIWG